MCNTLLAKFSSAFDADKRAKVRLLQRRAQFNDDAEKLTDKLPDALTPQATTLPCCCRRWSNVTPMPRTCLPGNRRTSIGWRGRLRGITDKLQAEHWGQEGTAQIDHYLGNLPRPFGDRLKGAAAIAAKSTPSRHPRSAGRRSAARAGEFVPEKRLAESLQLREVRTKQGELVRGFFKSVPDAAGGVAGYQCYPTQEQLLESCARR